MENTLTETLGRSRKIAVWVVACTMFVIAGIGGDRFFPRISDDFVYSYHPGALSLQHGQGYLDRNGELITHHPPGYSLLISPIVHSDVNRTITRVRWLVAALVVINVFLLSGILKIALPTIPQWIVLPLLVLWPPLLPLLNPGGSEMLFMVLLHFAVLLLLKIESRPADFRGALLVSLGAGLLLGDAVLTRVIGIAVVGAVLLSILLGWRNWSVWWRTAMAAGFLIVVTAAILPWLLIVKAHTGDFTLSTAGDYSIRSGIEVHHRFVAAREYAKPENWKNSENPILVFISVAKNYPLSAAGVLGAKIIHPWYATDSGRYMNTLMLFNLPWFVLTFLVVVRTILCWKRMPASVILLLGILGSCWLSAIVVHSLFRYMAAVFPAVIITVIWHINDFRIQRRNDNFEVVKAET